MRPVMPSKLAPFTLHARMCPKVSMLDCEIFKSITQLMNLCDHTRKGYADPNVDEFGDTHLILFGVLFQTIV